MDLTTPKYFEAPSFLASHGEPPLEEDNTSFYKKNMEMENPFADSFPDPLCKLNLKETSEFVKSFTMANHIAKTRTCLDVSAQRREGLSSVTKRNSVEAPPTPGRPIFSFSAGNRSRKGFPSKWDDADKWLNSSTSSFHDSPAHHFHGLNLKTSESSKFPKKIDGFRPQAEVFAEKSRVTEEKVSKSVSSIHGSVHLHHHISAKDLNGDVLLKDKFTNEVEVEPIIPKYRCLDSTKGFLFGKLDEKSTKAAVTEMMVHEVKQTDVGTEMTPLGSSTTSRCHTPFSSTSPARHNTPENRSGPLALLNSNIDITKLQDCHLDKLHMGAQFNSLVSTWSSREEEEEDISKSLRHFEIVNNECRRSSVSEYSKAACSREEEEKNKWCLRYQREEAKIQAWVNLQSAEAEAQSRKLEVKIERMRSDLEEKLMKRMAVVHRKAEEWRAVAQLQHSEKILRATKQAQKIVNRRNSQFSSHSSCSCFPCNNHVL